MKKVFMVLIAILLMSCSLTQRLTSTEALPAAEEEVETAAQQEPTKTPEPTNTPIALSDDEFAEGAQSTCQQLQEELSDIASSKESFVSRYALAAEAYQAAWDDLSEIGADAEFSTLALEFLTQLEALSILYEDYGQALEDAMADLELTVSDISYLAVTSEDKAFMVFANDKWNELTVDEGLKNDFYAAKAALKSAATELGLGACAEVDPIFPN